MNRLKYGEIAVGAPFSQARFEALCLDLRNVDPSTKEWRLYAEEIAHDYPNHCAVIDTEKGKFHVTSAAYTIRIEGV